jgi:hypothetical protein
MERLSAKAREQDLVLDADVLLQFRGQLPETFIKRAPGTQAPAGAFRPFVSAWSLPRLIMWS